ncbi:MAG: SGNH/GDSL hydrolase family protein [Planctomycetes bacterium]|nr:SGNH/GDSL hydrolase family protein [Planctomycetota bacterium]
MRTPKRVWTIDHLADLAALGSAGRMVRVRRLLGIAVGAPILAVLAAELTLRVAAPTRFGDPDDGTVRAAASWKQLLHRASERPGLHYELQPNATGQSRGVTITTNSLGMRDDELKPEDTPGLMRIALIGDSMVFGVGVEHGDTLPAQLERRLSSAWPERAVDVLNFGVSGYSTLDELAVLRERALPLAPRCVVLAYCLNDPEVEPLQPLPAHFTPKPWWNSWHLGHLVKTKLRGRAVARYGGGDYWRALHAADGPYWPIVARALDAFRDECASNHVPVLFVIQPMNLGRDPWSSYRYRDTHAFLAEQARARGFEVLDLLDTFVAHGDETLTIAGDDPHYNARGESLVARAVADWLVARRS